MKRSIFYLICAMAVGGTACDKLPKASTPSGEPDATPTPAVSPTPPPPVGEQLEQGPMPAHPSQEESPSSPRVPIYPGVGPGQSPSGQQMVPPHRKPPVSARMEV